MEQYLFHFSLSENDIVLLSIYLLAFLIQIIFYLVFFRRVAFYKKRKEGNDHLPPVSIVVPSRSCGEFLENNLPLILDQDYPEFEVIVVDNCSHDYTPEVLIRLKAKYPNLRSTFLPSETFFSWKLSLMLGAKAAKYEWLVFMDPFTTVNSKEWLKTLARNCDEDVDVVLGYGNNPIKGGYWSSMVRLERFVRNLYCLSFTLAGLPTYLEGRNIAFRRSAFFENKAFAGLLNRDYAENELLLQKFMTPERVRVELNPTSIVNFEEEIIRRDYHEFLLKNRLLWRDQKFNRKLLMTLDMLSKIVFYSMFIVLAFFQYFVVLVLPFFLMRIVLQVVMIKKAQKNLGEQKLFLSSLISGLWYPLFYFLGYISGRLIKRRRKWKK
ncbi:MAG: glycosyltransferase [Bacteroidota bacterium]|nr:glycosyltransferase [Bacteroidota bacterium]